MQDGEYLDFVVFDFVNGNVIRVKYVLLGSEDFPCRPDVLRLQNIHFFAKRLCESVGALRGVFGDVGGNRIETTQGSIRSA
jgi:hypothetical protein